VIVVDSNVIAYCWLNGPLTALAQGVRLKDPEWPVPILWRSEMRSILVGYLRDGSLSVAQITRVMEAAERALAGSEHLVPSVSVFEIAARSRLSAYDCEFVVLAALLGVPLVTADKAVLRAFPDQALTMDRYLKTEGGHAAGNR
jgi:predicted nucleic acid-binding protein